MSFVYFQIKDISKSFFGIKALSNVSLDLEKGKVHAVIGENGAGKSTLMNILYGAIKPDSGEIILEGKQVKIKTPIEAQKLGINMVHQELSVIDSMTIAENIFLGRELFFKGTPFLNSKLQNQHAKILLDELGFDVDPRLKLSKLSVANKQLVEIVKATSKGSNCIIMDEPTSSLSESEINHLFDVIKNLRKKGLTIVYISHKLDEVLEISDTTTVLRDGCFINKYLTKDVDKEKLIADMIGREYNAFFQKEESNIGDIKLRVHNLNKEGVFKDINFFVRKGEILGIFGLVGAGRTELVEAITGFNPADSGDIFIDNKKIKMKNTLDSIKKKIAFVPEDRKNKGLNLKGTVLFNISIINLIKYCLFKQFILKKYEKKEVEEQIRLLKIKASNVNQKVINLSGGNQQKTVLAKCLITKPEILILDEPTRGIDVGAKAEIHREISKLAQSGKAVILISSELPEILAMSDRLVTMHEGKIVGEFNRENFDINLIFAAIMNN